MRIIIVAEVYMPKVDGVVIRTMNLIQRLLERGDEVLVVCPEAEGRSDSPVPVVQFPSFPLPSYPEYQIGLPDQRLIETIQDFKPDVLHFLNPFAFGFRCHDVITKAGLDVPCLFSFHTLYGEFVKNYPFMKPLSKLLWWLMKSYHNRADVNLTVSSVQRDDLIERGFERVELWPPAVNSQLFSPERATAEMRNRLSGGHPEDPLFVTVSRLAPEKNVGFLAGVLKQVPNARLAIVGDGPQRVDLEKKFAGTNTTFHGYFKGEQLATAYASCDAFIYASETETLGNVILEAMASRLAVLAPRAGGIPSLIEEGQTGLMFEPGDLQGTIALAQRLTSDEAWRNQLGSAARQQVCEWSWENGADVVREHYQQVAAQHPARILTAKPSRIASLLLSSLVKAYRTQARLARSTQQSNSHTPESTALLSPATVSALNPSGSNHGNSH